MSYNESEGRSRHLVIFTIVDITVAISTAAYSQNSRTYMSLEQERPCPREKSQDFTTSRKAIFSNLLNHASITFKMLTKENSTLKSHFTSSQLHTDFCRVFFGSLDTHRSCFTS